MMKYIKYCFGLLLIIEYGIKCVKMIGILNIFCIILGNCDLKIWIELF